MIQKKDRWKGKEGERMDPRQKGLVSWLTRTEQWQIWSSRLCSVPPWTVTSSVVGEQVRGEGSGEGGIGDDKEVDTFWQHDASETVSAIPWTVQTEKKVIMSWTWLMKSTNLDTEGDK